MFCKIWGDCKTEEVKDPAICDANDNSQTVINRMNKNKWKLYNLQKSTCPIEYLIAIIV